jgi:P27 family predicted phage terminase small subunit
MGITKKYDIGPAPKSLDAQGRLLWETIRVSNLSGTLNLKRTDRKAVEQFCRLYSEFRSCSEEISKQGFHVKTATGHVTINPLLRTLNEIIQKIKNTGSELGFSPVSRIIKEKA